MNALLQSTATHTQLRRDAPVARPGGIPTQPRAGIPPIAARPRRHALSRILAAMAGRRRTSRLPGPSCWASAGTGLSPIAGGASRGVTILGRR